MLALCITKRQAVVLLLLSGGAKGKFLFASFQCHDSPIFVGYQGQGTDIEIHAKHTLAMGKRLNEILSKHTWKPIEQQD
jgi:ATP-dependent Clp protease protease subunit